MRALNELAPSIFNKTNIISSYRLIKIVFYTFPSADKAVLAENRAYEKP